VDADEDVKPYLQAARLAVRLGEKEEAFRALSLAWQMNPNDPEVRAALLDIGVVPGPTMRMTTGG
jgi:Flp pilus assembly protein TadD